MLLPVILSEELFSNAREFFFEKLCSYCSDGSLLGLSSSLLLLSFIKYWQRAWPLYCKTGSCSTGSEHQTKNQLTFTWAIHLVTLLYYLFHYSYFSLLRSLYKEISLSLKLNGNCLSTPFYCTENPVESQTLLFTGALHIPNLCETPGECQTCTTILFSYKGSLFGDQKESESDSITEVKQKWIGLYAGGGRDPKRPRRIERDSQYGACGGFQDLVYHMCTQSW